MVWGERKCSRVLELSRSQSKQGECEGRLAASGIHLGFENVCDKLP